MIYNTMKLVPFILGHTKLIICFWSTVRVIFTYYTDIYKYSELQCKYNSVIIIYKTFCLRGKYHTLGLA